MSSSVITTSSSPSSSSLHDIQRTSELVYPGILIDDVKWITQLRVSLNGAMKGVQRHSALSAGANRQPIRSTSLFDVFPGTVIVSMTKKDIPNLYRYPYAISVKSNGVRYLCHLCLHGGNPTMVFVNRSGQAFQYPIMEMLPSSVFQGTWFDGEWIQLRNGQYEFQLFDVIQLGGKAVHGFDYEKRMALIQLSLESYDRFHYEKTRSSIHMDPSGTALTSKWKPLDFLRLHSTVSHVVPFMGMRTKEIFLISQAGWVVRQWRQMVPFDTDGVVLTQLSDPYISGQCFHSYKFKEIQDITIDFGCTPLSTVLSSLDDTFRFLWTLSNTAQQEGQRFIQRGFQKKHLDPMTELNGDADSLGILWTDAGQTPLTVCHLPKGWNSADQTLMNQQGKESSSSSSTSSIASKSWSSLLQNSPSSRIVECGWNDKNNEFEIHQIRWDKRTPNSRNTIELTKLNLDEKLTFEDVFGSLMKSVSATTRSFPFKESFPEWSALDSMRIPNAKNQTWGFLPEKEIPPQTKRIYTTD